MSSSSTTSRRLALVVALLVAAGAMGLLMFGNIGDNLVYYWTPTQLREAGDKAIGATVRLGGQVEEGSVVWDEPTNELTFRVSDGTTSVTVHSHGVPPDLFREGIGAVVEGQIPRVGADFQATRLIMKHNNEYRAPDESGHHPDDPFASVEGL